MQITTAKMAKAIPVEAKPTAPPKAKPVEGDDTNATAEEVPTYGLFLASEDMEELFPLLRRGSSVTFVE